MSAPANKADLITVIQRIVSYENFQMDAYFLCGVPSTMPNEGMLKACKAYLAADAATPAQVQELIQSLEQALAKQTVQKNRVLSEELSKHMDDVKTVLDHKDLL